MSNCHIYNSAVGCRFLTHHQSIIKFICIEQKIFQPFKRKKRSLYANIWCVRKRHPTQTMNISTLHYALHIDVLQDYFVYIPNIEDNLFHLLSHVHKIVSAI